MTEVIFQIAFLFALFIFNGLFSMTEIAVVSSRRVRLSRAADDGNAGAAAALALQQSPENFLSTVQIGITLVGVLSGAFGGAMLSDELALLVSQVPALQPYSETIAFGIVILAITYFSLVIGELVPKNLALTRPEAVASLLSRPMAFISKITAPFVWILSRSTTVVLKLLRISQSTDAAITEEEIRAHIAHGTELGVLEEEEQELIESIIRLDDQRVTAIMTPRVKIDRIDLDDDAAVNRDKLISTRFSRLPVCRGNLDNVVGMIKSRDLLAHVLAGGDLEFEQLLKEPVFVPETKTALELLEALKSSSSSLALVVDEFGSVAGLVTMNDVLEQIVGDLPVAGVVDRSVIVREDGSMLLDGQLSVVDFRDILKLKTLPDHERDAYQTLAGFVLTRIEKLPIEGDSFEWEGYRFEVVDMDARRVDKVLVSRLSNEAAGKREDEDA